MATQSARSTGDEYEQMFPDWVYQIPGVLLILVGFGGLLFLTLS